ncbi:MAG: archaetidylserine decarboxylase, partial [Polyangiales bacterium]
FTRKLRPGARPAADQEGVLLAPADGRLEGCAPIAAGLAMRVKGQHFSLADLLADEAAAARLARGRYALIYLSPRDYHRVHAPVRGPVCACKHIPGALFPVNALGMRCVPQLFVSNERIVVQQQSKDFGLVCTVLVGAFAVGRIELCFPTSAQHEAPSQPAAQLQRGDEVGIFHLGSTVVVISEHAGHCDHRPLSDSIRVGQALWTQDAP